MAHETFPFARPCFVVGALLLGACSSDDGSAKQSGATACNSDPTLVARRDACEFTKGSKASETIGGCTGNAIPIEHIVVIMQENRSFDQYFGHLKGNGLDDVEVPPESTTNPSGDGSGTPIPWHHESAYCVTDTDHGWQASHTEWDGGKMDGFPLSNIDPNDPTGQRSMGYYDRSDIPFYYDLISTFATSDHYHCSLLGPTYPNRMYLYAATSYGIVTTNVSKLAPPGSPNVLRELDAAGRSWMVYKTDLPSALVADPSIAGDFTAHFVDISQFATDAAAGTLPDVAFLDAQYLQPFSTESDEHPPSDMQVGQHWVRDKVKALMASPQWPTTALFITYDENGGLYDHVPPPPACVPDDTPPALNPELGGFDRLGFRVPLIVVSPFARRHFVSHETHSHTSILRFIEAKFDLPAFTNRDANSDALLDLFDFASPPNLAVPNFAEPLVDQAQMDACKVNFP